MSYKKGKRAWINSEIFGIKGADSLNFQENPKLRPIFGAGDSDTDSVFLEDASELRLYIDVKPCFVKEKALENIDGKWLFQPVFEVEK